MAADWSTLMYVASVVALVLVVEVVAEVVARLAEVVVRMRRRQQQRASNLRQAVLILWHRDLLVRPSPPPLIHV